MTGGGTLVTILCIRALLFLGAYAALPWLIGEARHVSLEAENAGTFDTMSLPRVAHARIRAMSKLSHIKRVIESFLPKALSWSSLLFCVSAEESVCIFALALLERMHVDESWLLLHWHISLVMMMMLIVLGLPICACYLLCFGSVQKQRSNVRAMASVSLFVAWCFCFLRVPFPATESTATVGFFRAILSRTAVIGVSLIAVLSGSVAAGAIYDSYEMFVTRRETTTLTSCELERDSASIRAAFEHTYADLQARRSAVTDLENELDIGHTRSFDWSRFFNFSRKDKQLASMHAEISGLVSMANALRKELETQEERERRLRYAHTWPGCAWLLCNYMFSLYCVMRFIQCVLNLVIFGYESISTRDLMSTSVAQLMRMVGLHVDVDAWSPTISVLLLGGLIVMRMRVILGSLSSMIQSVSTGISTQLLVLFTAQVLCIYVLAALIQLHAGMNLGATGHPSRLLASLPDFQRTFGRIFDIMFLLSAILSGVHRWFVSLPDTIFST